jgi:hypothetical protein
LATVNKVRKYLCSRTPRVFLLLVELGFVHTVLSELRTRLQISGAERRLLDLLVQCARGRGLLKARGKAADGLDPRAGRRPSAEPG